MRIDDDRSIVDLEWDAQMSDECLPKRTFVVTYSYAFIFNPDIQNLQSGTFEFVNSPARIPYFLRNHEYQLTIAEKRGTAVQSLIHYRL